ncbi:MAG: 50S ribosomal protein L24 [Candidatus Peregrinibacteria bacterium]
MKIQKGDTVVVITGKDRKKQGEVLRVIPKDGKLVVKGLNIITKHRKKTRESSGERLQYEAPLDASNVMLIDPASQMPTRVGYLVSKEGRKQRVAKKTGSVITHNFTKS